MRPSDIRDTLLTLIPAHEPALLVGSPGVGKTDMVKEVATTLDYDLLISHPVVDDPTDYKGMPSVVRIDDEMVAQFLPFGNLRKLINAERETIAFADDLGQAPPAVQAAYMQLVLAREINGQRISDKVRFIAATNRRKDQAAVSGMITPLLDRFTTVLDYEFNLDDWMKWGYNAGMPDILLSFVKFRPDYLSKFEPSRDMKKSATPRSVAGVGRLLKLSLFNMDVLSGAAGEAFATEFLAFHNTWSRMPTRESIYRDPENTEIPNLEESAVLYALMGSIAYGMTTQNIGNAIKYLDRCPKEFAVLCMKEATRRHEELTTTRELARWALENREAFGFVNQT
jgi:hypothetical protein